LGGGKEVIEITVSGKTNKRRIYFPSNNAILGRFLITYEHPIKYEKKE
jgi:hypothetical protein